MALAKNLRCIGYFEEVETPPYIPGESKTQQQFRNVNDLNAILKNRHPQTVPMAQIEGMINDLTEQPGNLTEQFEQHRQMADLYEKIPYEIRSKFRSPEEMFDFLGDKKNRPQAELWGLLKKPVVPEPTLADQIGEGIVKAQEKAAAKAAKKPTAE